jgi:hypothetical protein
MNPVPYVYDVANCMSLASQLFCYFFNWYRIMQISDHHSVCPILLHLVSVVDNFFTVKVPDEFPVCICSVSADFNSIVLEYFALECFLFCDRS